MPSRPRSSATAGRRRNTRCSHAHRACPSTRPSRSPCTGTTSSWSATGCSTSSPRCRQTRPFRPIRKCASKSSLRSRPTCKQARSRRSSSNNSEDLDGFPCAGCYDSAKGDPAKGVDDVLNAIKFTYSTVWKFRTFEERAYYSVDHHSVAMALLVHNNFPDAYEKANGVAITANPFDESGLEPAFYINVQFGGKVEVVAPPAGTTSDQILYFFDNPNQPITYLAHSNIISADSTVLSRDQVHSLGVALDAIHERFSPAYGPAAGNKGFYAMDIEFKFSNEA